MNLLNTKNSICNFCTQSVMSRNHIFNVLVFLAAISVLSCIAKEVTSPLEFPFMLNGQVHQYPVPTALDSTQGRELGLSSLRGTEISGNDAYLLVTSRPKMDEQLQPAYLIQSAAPISLVGSKSTSSLSQSHQVLRTRVRRNGDDNDSSVHNSKFVRGNVKRSFDWIYNALVKELPKAENYEEEKRNYPKVHQNPSQIGERHFRSARGPLEEYKLLRRLRSISGSTYNGGGPSTFGRFIAFKKNNRAATGDQSDYFLRFLPRSNPYDKY